MKKHARKFKPVVTKIRLNPEQAVLSCACFDMGKGGWGMTTEAQPALSVCRTMGGKWYLVCTDYGNGTTIS